MSDIDNKLAEIRERHRKDARWHCGPSMICPQSHDDRAFLLAEIERLRARVEVLERACRLIEGDPDPHAVVECVACYRHSRLAYHALEAKP
jgi:hypothetical protein